MQRIKPRFGIYPGGSQTWLNPRSTGRRNILGGRRGWEIPGLTPDLLKWDFPGKARNLSFFLKAARSLIARVFVQKKPANPRSSLTQHTHTFSIQCQRRAHGHSLRQTLWSSWSRHLSPQACPDLCERVCLHVHVCVPTPLRMLLSAAVCLPWLSGRCHRKS